MKGLRSDIRTFATALTGQFCKEIGLNAPGEMEEVDFGSRDIWARFKRSVSAIPWWNCVKNEKITGLIEGQKDL